MRKAKKPLSSRGALGQELAVDREDLGGLLDRPERRAADDGVDVVQAEHERGDDAEVAAAAADRPEEVGVLVGAGADALAVGEHDVGGSSRLSMVRPYLRVRWPRPPPRVSPPTPVVEMIPLGVARPCSLVARSTSPHVQPPPTRTVRACGSTSMSFSSERSMTTPSSHVPRPAPLWPPPRTARSRPCSRAKPTAFATSSAPAQRAISAGALVDHRVVDLARLVVVGVVGADQTALEPRELPARGLGGCRDCAHVSSFSRCRPGERYGCGACACHDPG